MIHNEHICLLVHDDTYNTKILIKTIEGGGRTEESEKLFFELLNFNKRTPKHFYKN